MPAGKLALHTLLVRPSWRRRRGSLFLSRRKRIQPEPAPQETIVPGSMSHEVLEVSGSWGNTCHELVETRLVGLLALNDLATSQPIIVSL